MSYYDLSASDYASEEDDESQASDNREDHFARIPSDNIDHLWTRSIVHVDVDCFYCQCEQVDGPPDYRERPLAIGQKHIVVTCNYLARAIVHPSAIDCVKDYLHDYTILERDVPVHPNDIQSNEYKQLIKFGSGCCGAREFLKLHAYTLSEDIVVHLDYDVIMLQPLDELFDAMMSDDASVYNITTPRNAVIPKRVNVFFTRDYIQRSGLAMNEPLKFAVQGGFFIIRPNITLYQEMISILRRGNYNDKTGWENSRIGKFYGAAQIQGFLAYIYAELYPEHAVEINRCIYNTMVYDEPMESHGKCRTGEEKCDDCRITPLQDIKLVHYAMCQDPWYCTLPTVGQPPERCRHVLTEWFRVRQGLDKQRGHVAPIVETNDWTLGYCKNGTYSPIQRHQR